MSDDELVAWARGATKGMKESSVFMNLWNRKMRDDPFDDPVPLLQMGYAVFLDKPVIVLAERGTELPKHLLKMADAVEFYDRHDEESVQAAALAALRKVGMAPGTP